MEGTDLRVLEPPQPVVQCDMRKSQKEELKDGSIAKGKISKEMYWQCRSSVIPRLATKENKHDDKRV